MSRIAIIGAGAAGLVLARHVQASGGNAVVYERSDSVGGVWRFDETGTDTGRPAYAALSTNTSRQVMGFSEFPFPTADHAFPTRGEVESYLQTYCDVHGLSKRIRFQQEVTSARRNADGKFRIATAGTHETEDFDFLAVCSGQYKTSHIPPVYASSDSAVPLLHSANFRHASPFQGKRVLVVGAGNSGADIAVELHHAGAQVALSVPNPAWVIPKHIDGVPYDFLLSNLTLKEPFKVAQARFEAHICEEYARRGIDVEKYRRLLAWAPLDFQRSRMTVNSELVGLVDRDAIQVLGKGVTFDRGTVTDTDNKQFSCDVAIVATGYKPHFPFLDADCQPVQDNVLSLYKHVFHPKIPGLAFLGMCGVVGAIFPVVELQARWVASCFLGRGVLPGQSQMADAVSLHNTLAATYGIKAARTIQVDYMETLAWELGLGEADARKRMVGGSDRQPVTSAMYSANEAEILKLLELNAG